MEHIFQQGVSLPPVTPAVPPAAPRDPDNDPPYSRIFITCKDCGANEEQFKEFFASCGEIEYVKILKDKDTHVPKGHVYVKFKRASSAAWAVEKMNGKTMLENGIPSGSPMKVCVATPKGAMNVKSTEPEDNPPHSRLFITCSKDVTEDQLIEKFQDFTADIEYVRLMKEKGTQQSKGYAYIKFTRSYTAALAMETLNEIQERVSHENPNAPKFKVIIAESKTKRLAQDLSLAYRPPALPGQPTPTPVAAPGTVPGINSDPNYPPNSRLFIVLTGNLLPETYLYQVFSPFGGLEYIKLQPNKNYGYVKYSTTVAAQYAVHYLNGAEVVPGTHLKVVIAEPPRPSTDLKRQRTT